MGQRKDDMQKEKNDYAADAVVPPDLRDVVAPKNAAVDVAEVRKRILKIRGYLAAATIDREEQIEMLLAGLVTGLHAVMVGPPGTAKSFLCDRLAECCDATQMSHLMTKFTTPDEVFGGVDFKSLQAQGLHKRNLAGGLADVEIAILDEIFKSNGAMFDALLKILNEGKYRDQAGGEIKVPLRFVMAASNEFPHTDNAAAYDRFLLRDMVGPVEGDRNQMRLLELPDAHAQATPKPPCMVTTAELDAVKAQILKIRVPQSVRKQIIKLRKVLAKDGVTVSDRRFGKGQTAMKASAWLEGESEVSVDDLQILRYVWWKTPADREAVIAALASLDKTETAKSLSEIDEALRAFAQRPVDEADLIAAAPDLIAQIKATGAVIAQRMGDGALSRRGKAKVERRMGELHAAYQTLRDVLAAAPLY